MNSLKRFWGNPKIGSYIFKQFSKTLVKYQFSSSPDVCSTSGLAIWRQNIEGLKYIVSLIPSTSEQDDTIEFWIQLGIESTEVSSFINDSDSFRIVNIDFYQYLSNRCQSSLDLYVSMTSHNIDQVISSVLEGIQLILTETNELTENPKLLADLLVEYAISCNDGEEQEITSSDPFVFAATLLCLENGYKEALSVLNDGLNHELKQNKAFWSFDEKIEIEENEKTTERYNSIINKIKSLNN